MTAHTPRAPRAVAQRRAIGRRLRAYRMANGLTIVQVAAHLRTGKEQMQAAENAITDLYFGTVIDIAELYGLHVALATDFHLPMLDLTADEVDTIRDVVALFAERVDAIDTEDAVVASALDKLTTTTEEPTND